MRKNRFEKKWAGLLMSAVITASLLSGCGSSGDSSSSAASAGSLNVFVWTEYVSESSIKAFEEEGKLPASISSIVTMGSDMRLYFKKIPNMTPSTGGFVFDDIAYDYLEHNEG